MASDGTFAYSAGGFEGELGGISNGFFRYDPVANTWTSLPPLPTAVGSARGVYAANTNSFYVFGGFDRNNALNITQVFNFGTNTWSTGAAMPAARFFSNLAYDSTTGKIFVIGGFHSPHFPEDSQTWEYDPVLNAWNTTRANIPVGMGGSATSIAGQFIYLVGTWNNSAASNVHYRYDITGNTWTAMAVAPAPVYEATGAAIGGQTYMIGGGNPTSPQNSTYVYDIASNTWSTGPNLNVARSFTAGTAIGARLLVVGGGIGGPPPFVTDTVEVTQGSCGAPTPTATPGGTPSPAPTVTATPPATATPGGTATPTPSPCVTIFAENFDEWTPPLLPPGWVPTNATGPAPLWVTSPITPDSPPNDAFVDDPQFISDKRLDTPGIAITSASAQLRFRNNFNTEHDPPPLEVFYDGGVLEVSSPNINGGAFTDITDPAVGGSFVTGGYTGTIDGDGGNLLANRMAWSGDSGGYINTVVNLGPNVNGQTIKLRFRMGTDVVGSAPGWRIDTIAVTAGVCPSPTPTPSATPTTTPGGTPTPSPTPTICPSVITHSTSQEILSEGSAACTEPGFVIHANNSYWRAFNMATFTGSQQYNVTSVSFGIQNASVFQTGLTQTATVRLHTQTTGTFPGGTRAQIATTTFDVPNQTQTIMTVPLTATVPAGTTELIMEVFTPSALFTRTSIIMGSNAAPETGPSYISSPDCEGFFTPTPTADIGFPDMHMVFNVNSNCGTATPVPSPTATATPSASSTPATPTPTPTPTPVATPTPTPPPAAQAVNLSTRMRVQTGDNVGIGGFIISGFAPKHVLLRGIGPSLTQFGVPNALPDTVLELHGQAITTITNDNWRDNPAQETAILATGLAPTNNLESAIDVTLNPGAYTAVVRGKNNTTGVALVEVYDLSQAVPSKLANISTRAFVGTGNDIVIAGFILGNQSGNDRIVVRGIGPSLTSFGVPDALADPTLELRDSNGALLVMNNDWQDDPAQAVELTAAGLAPTNQLESGIAAALAPGLYTALLAGLDNGTGNGVVEAYDRGAP